MRAKESMQNAINKFYDGSAVSLELRRRKAVARPVLEAQLEGMRPAHAAVLRRNVALHSGQLSGPCASMHAWWRAQRGPRLGQKSRSADEAPSVRPSSVRPCSVFWCGAWVWPLEEEREAVRQCTVRPTPAYEPTPPTNFEEEQSAVSGSVAHPTPLYVPTPAQHELEGMYDTSLYEPTLRAPSPKASFGSAWRRFSAAAVAEEWRYERQRLLWKRAAEAARFVAAVVMRDTEGASLGDGETSGWDVDHLSRRRAGAGAAALAAAKRAHAVWERDAMMLLALAWEEVEPYVASEQDLDGCRYGGSWRLHVRFHL